MGSLSLVLILVFRLVPEVGGVHVCVDLAHFRRLKSGNYKYNMYVHILYIYMCVGIHSTLKCDCHESSQHVLR